MYATRDRDGTFCLSSRQFVRLPNNRRRAPELAGLQSGSQVLRALCLILAEIEDSAVFPGVESEVAAEIQKDILLSVRKKLRLLSPQLASEYEEALSGDVTPIITQAERIYRQSWALKCPPTEASLPRPSLDEALSNSSIEKLQGLIDNAEPPALSDAVECLRHWARWESKPRLIGYMADIGVNDEYVFLQWSLKEVGADAYREMKSEFRREGIAFASQLRSLAQTKVALLTAHGPPRMEGQMRRSLIETWSNAVHRFLGQ